MRATEFTQPRSAGCIVVAEDTGRWCLQQRSNTVSDPGVWSTWGGGSEPGETLPQTVRRELAEESGYTGPVQLTLVDSRPEYATFVALVPHEFRPQLNSECQDWCWCEPDQLPEPLHPGLAQVVSAQLQENRSFNRCYDRACQLYDRAEAKGVDATLLQVANYQGDGSDADPRWRKLPQYVWKHYVTVIGDTVYDPTAEQFGAGRPKKYSVDELKSQWKELYTIRSTAVNEDAYDMLEPHSCGPFDGGCVAVAQALQQIHGGSVVVLTDADDRAQHAAVLANGQLIDYDGAADPKEFVQRFEQNERVRIQGIRPIHDRDLPDAPRDTELVAQLVQTLSENFADGKVKGKSRPGRVRRAGASCKGSVTDLRARAKKYSGERGKMYHWCANMKSGRNKNK